MSSELKTQFLNFMTLQRFSDHTKRSYVTGVKLLSKYYMQSPDTLTNDQIQDYIRHLVCYLYLGLISDTFTVSVLLGLQFY